MALIRFARAGMVARAAIRGEPIRSARPDGDRIAGDGVIPAGYEPPATCYSWAMPQDEPMPPWSEDLGVRFVRAGFVRDTMRAWWCDGHLVGPEHDADRRGYLAMLREAEMRQGPPTLREMDRKLQIEAELDPGMPAWIKRPWYVPREQMLAAEVILVEAVGFGYSASGVSFIGEEHLRGSQNVSGLDLLVHPVPGVLPPDREARAAEEARTLDRMLRAGVERPRLRFWNDAEPSKAFHGLMCGRIVRRGHMALGIPYIENYGEGW